jgi:hypothetical protein
MRRFLVSYQFNLSFGSGFGSVYYDRPDDALPGPAAILGIRERVASHIGRGATKGAVVILAVSEVSAEGEVVA